MADAIDITIPDLGDFSDVEHFEVDKRYITVAALKALADDKVFDSKTVAQAIKDYGIDPDKADPVTL